MLSESAKDKCFQHAILMIQRGLVKDMDVFELTELFIKIEEEKEEKNQLSDKNIDYNDPIVSIEEVGELTTKDISVTGDNLFYCNGILTKNSFGLPAVADFMFAAIQTEQYEQLGQYMIKQLKNRYNHKSANKRFVVGVDTPHMRLYNVEEEAQDEIVDDKPVMDNSDVGARISDEMKSKVNKFNKNKFTEFK